MEPVWARGWKAKTLIKYSSNLIEIKRQSRLQKDHTTWEKSLSWSSHYLLHIYSKFCYMLPLNVVFWLIKCSNLQEVTAHITKLQSTTKLQRICIKWNTVSNLIAICFRKYFKILKCHCECHCKYGLTWYWKCAGTPMMRKVSTNGYC